MSVYFLYLVFQLFSHRRLYDDKNVHKPETIKYAPRTRPSSRDGSQKSPGPSTTDKEVGRHDATKFDDGEDCEQVPKLSLPVTLVFLVVITVLIGVTAEGLVHSVGGLARRGPISKEFIGFILLPIVGNAPECFTAVTVSVRDKLTSGLVTTVGSSIVSPPPLIVSSVACITFNFPPANFVIRHPVHRRPRVGDWSSDYDALRPARVRRALLLHVNRQLRRAKWKI